MKEVHFACKQSKWYGSPSREWQRKLFFTFYYLPPHLIPYSEILWKKKKKGMCKDGMGMGITTGTIIVIVLAFDDVPSTLPIRPRKRSQEMSDLWLWENLVRFSNLSPLHTSSAEIDKQSSDQSQEDFHCQDGKYLLQCCNNILWNIFLKKFTVILSIWFLFA